MFTRGTFLSNKVSFKCLFTLRYHLLLKSRVFIFAQQLFISLTNGEILNTPPTGDITRVKMTNLTMGFVCMRTLHFSWLPYCPQNKVCSW